LILWSGESNMLNPHTGCLFYRLKIDWAYKNFEELLS